MRTRLIPAEQWRAMFDELSRTHDGALVSLEVVGGEVGAEQEVRDQPLRGLSSDTSGVVLQKLGSRDDGYPRALRERCSS